MGFPIGRFLPSSLSIHTRSTGGAKYRPVRSRSWRSARFASRSRSYAFFVTLPAPLLRALLSARSRRDALRLRQDVVHPVAPIPGLRARKQTALPSSRATPLHTCPVLKPRWCPGRSPVMLAGLPPSVTRRTSAFPPRSEVILRDLRVRWQFRRFRNGPQSGSLNPLSTTIEISGLNHAAYALVTPGFRRPLTVSPRVRY